MSRRADEELETILALYGCRVTGEANQTVETECKSCGSTFYQYLKKMDEKLAKHGEACLQYCNYCAKEKGIV